MCLVPLDDDRRHAGIAHDVRAILEQRLREEAVLHEVKHGFAPELQNVDAAWGDFSRVYRSLVKQPFLTLMRRRPSGRLCLTLCW